MRQEPPARLLYRGDLGIAALDTHDRSGPVAIWFHGGGWVDGRADNLLRPARHLQRRGIASMLVEYRVHARDGTMVADAIADAIAATRFLLARTGRRRVFLGGASAGGLLAIHAAAAAGREVDGLFLISPVLDLSAQGFRSAAVPAGGDEGLSPLHMALPRLPPTLLLHGLRDRLVPAGDTGRFAERLRAAGGVADLELFPPCGHGFHHAEPWRSLVAALLHFFIRRTADAAYRRRPRPAPAAAPIPAAAADGARPAPVRQPAHAGETATAARSPPRSPPPAPPLPAPATPVATAR